MAANNPNSQMMMDRSAMNVPEAPPSLYPPRILPKSLRRKPRDNRILLAAQTIEDHLVFSGYRLDDENSTDTRFRFRSIIGKQSIYQELDLHATLATENLTTALTQRIHQDDNNTSAPSAATAVNNKRNAGGRKSTTTTTTTSTTSLNDSSASFSTTPAQTFDIASNSDLTLYGTAMVSFPAELRRFFYKVAEPNNYHPLDHRPSLSRGMALHRHYTNLGPFAPMDKTLPVRYSHLYDKTKAKIFTEAFSELTRSVQIQFNNRYQTRYVNPPSSLAARAQKQKQLQAAKLKKMLKREAKAAGNYNSDDDDDDDDEENAKPAKRSASKRSAGSGSDHEEDDDAGDDSGSDAGSSEESELDFDMGEVHDDDDDDYGGGASGDDEPTF